MADFSDDFSGQTSQRGGNYSPSPTTQFGKLRITIPQTPHVTKSIQWNDTLESTAQYIGELAGGYHVVHLQQARRAEKVHNFLMISSIVLGPVSGALSGVNVGLDNASTSMSIVSTVCGFLSGIIVAVVKFNKYDEYSLAHKHAARKYASIANNVRRQLGLYRSERVDASTYLEWLEAKFDEAFVNAPLLDNKKHERYMREKGFDEPPTFSSSRERIAVHREPTELGDLSSTSHTPISAYPYAIPRPSPSLHRQGDGREAGREASTEVSREVSRESSREVSREANREANREATNSIANDTTAADKEISKQVTVAEDLTKRKYTLRLETNENTANIESQASMVNNSSISEAASQVDALRGRENVRVTFSPDGSSMRERAIHNAANMVVQSALHAQKEGSTLRSGGSSSRRASVFDFPANSDQASSIRSSPGEFPDKLMEYEMRRLCNKT